MSSIPTTSPRISTSNLAAPLPLLGQEVTTGSQEIKAGTSQIKTSSAQVSNAGTDSFERAAVQGKNAGNETLNSLGSAVQGGKDVGHEARAQAGQVADGASQIAQGAKDEAKNVGNKAANAAEGAIEAGKNGIDKGKQKAQDASEQVSELAQNTANAAQSGFEKSKAKAKDFGESASQTASDVKEGTSRAANKLGEKAKKAGDQIGSTARAGYERTQSGLASAGESLHNGATAVRREVAPRARSLLSTLALPITYPATKIAGGLKNIGVAHSGEIASPAWGYAAVAAGTLGYVLATAGSWGATLFITTPALAATVGTLGALYLLQKFAARLLKGAPTAAVTDGTVTTEGRRGYQRKVAANNAFAAEIKLLDAELAEIDKDDAKNAAILDGAKETAAKNATRRAVALASKADMEESFHKLTETIVKKDAEPVDLGAAPALIGPEVETVAVA